MSRRNDLLVAGLAAILAVPQAWAQESDHSMHQPPTEEPEQPDPHAGHDMPEPEQPDPHAGHVMPAAEPDAIDHAAMGHAMPGGEATAEPIEPIPVVTPADRAAAFPDVEGHTVHDDAVHSFWLVDRLEAWDADEEGTGLGWEAVAWIGTDLDRLWLRSEGEHVDGSVESGELEVLYGRAVARWWDALVGVRHAFGHGPSSNALAIGVTGLAPYKFEVDATAYLGGPGDASLELEAEYETLFTNRLILQWAAGAELHARDDPGHGVASGLSTVEAGLRLRYEIRREFAPYVGVAWERAFGGTADLRRDASQDIDDTRVIAGVRVWF